MRYLLLALTCLTLACSSAMAQKDSTGGSKINKILKKADTLIKKVSAKPSGNGNTPTSAPVTCTSVLVSHPAATCHGIVPGTSDPAYSIIPAITNNSGQIIISWAVTGNGVTLLNGGTPVATYIGSPATLTTGNNSIPAIMFAYPNPMPVYFNYTFTFADGSSCTSKIAVDYTPCATSSCNCNPWPSAIKYGTNPVSDVNPPTYINTIANNGTITLTANEYLTFPGIAAPGCTGNPCASSLSYEIYNPAGSLLISTPGHFDVGTLWEQPCNNTGKYKIVIKAKCGTTSCNDYVLWVNKPCSVPQSCDCGTWQQGKATYTILNTLNTNSPVDCGKQLTVDCDKPVTITNSINCTGQCAAPAIATYVIYNPNGSVNTTGTGTTVTFTPGLSTPAPYKVVLKSTCGTNKCDSCVIYVNTKCTAPPVCDCGSWEILTLNDKGFKCGDKTDWKCNELAKFSARYSCNPNTAACAATIKCTVSKDGTVIQQFGSGTAPFIYGQFTPTENGIYEIKMYPDCSGKSCQPCTYTLVVKDCKGCSCKGWGPVKYTYAKDGIEQPWQSIKCGSTTPITAKQGQPYQFISGIICSTPECKATGKTTVFNESGNPVYTTEGLILKDYYFKNCGKYRIVFSGNCGTNKCEDCVLLVDVPCCDCGSWGEKLRVNDDGTTSELDTCGSKLGAAQCGYSGKLKVRYNCSPQCATIAQIIYQYYNASTNTPVGLSITVASGAIATITNPTTSGSYYLKISAKCGDKICDECRLYFTLDCKPIDCCKGGSWDKKYLKNQLISCNTNLPLTVSLPVNSLQTVNYKYNCNPANPEQCQAAIRYVLKTNTGVQVGPVSTAPSGVNGQIRMPATAGSYCLWAYAYCGESPTACDSCKVCFNVTCDNCEGVNVSCNMNGNTFTLVGNITSPANRPVKKVIIELADVTARNANPGVPASPVPNFEFVSAGTSVNGSVLLKHSLYGMRSNIVESNFATPSSNIPYTLKISDDIAKVMLRYRIKLTIIFTDGSYCEQVKTNIAD